MFHDDGSTLRVARYILANADEATMRYERSDFEAAEDLDLTVRTYRDALRTLHKIGVIYRDPVKRGPARREERRERVCFLHVAHPFWMLAMASDELAGWRR